MFEEFVLFLLLGAAMGIIALVSGVPMIVKAARQMERAASLSSEAT